MEFNDTFCEQIVPVNKSGKAIACIIGLIIALIMVLFGLYILFCHFQGFMSIIFLLAIGAVWCDIKLIKRFNIEYEYIITNGTLDVDKIINRSSRKRVLSCEIKNIERIEKYNHAAPPIGNFKETVIACSVNNDSAYFVVVSEEGKGSRLIVFAPNDKTKVGIKKSLPKFLALSAFKD